MYGGKSWYQLDDEGHQRFPGDYEAQVGQGRVTLHSEEQLAGSDRGVTHVPHALQARRSRPSRRAPIRSASPAPSDDALVHLQAGNYLVQPSTTAD